MKVPDDTANDEVDLLSKTLSMKAESAAGSKHENEPRLAVPSCHEEDLLTPT